METEKSESATESPGSSSLEDKSTSNQPAEKAVHFRGRRSLPDEEDTNAKKSGRKRRMSTGMMYKSPTSITDDIDKPREDEVSNWEDLQDLATSGDDTGSELGASEIESQNLLASLEPYVPRLLFHSVLYDTETQLGKIPTSMPFFGAVMIADISGFTTLTERALTSKRGTELVEELLVAMNNYFSQACEIILMFGGDVVNVQGSSFIASVEKSRCMWDIKSSNTEATALFCQAFQASSTYKLLDPNVTYYAGDAMIICFPQCAAISETEDALALRAASCAFELITCLGVYTPELGGYGDTLIMNEGGKKDMNMTRRMSRPSTPDLEDRTSIESNMTVLVVDDNSMHRVVLRQMLMKLKCEVMEADSGKAAVAANSKEQFDAIFMDIHMSGMDVCLATRQIRGSNRPKTPIIGVCTKCDEDMRNRCINAGMNEILVKPLVMSHLVSLLRRLKSAQDQDTSIDGSSIENELPGGAISGVYREHERPKDPPKEAMTGNQGKDLKRRDSDQQWGKGQRRGSTPNLNQPKSGTSTVPPGDAPVVLTMKVLVGMGQVAMLSVGGGPQMPSGKPRWEFFMTDVPLPSDSRTNELRKPMEQLRLCEQVATPGTVILSPEVWAHCQTYCEAKDLADGFVQLVHVKTHSFTRPAPEAPYDNDRVPTAVGILKRYLPEMVTSKLEAVSTKEYGESDLRPEVRHVTCLFLGFPGVSDKKYSDSELLNHLQKLMLTVQKSLRFFDGLLVQFKMDEKGYVMICGFGFPGNLHEDDPKRGVQTALELHKKLAALGQSTGIGVTTGKLLCTCIGSKKRREYTAFGNCINLSARLMKKANNEVLIDMDTHSLTKDEFEVEALPPMNVKGRTGLIDVYRLKGVKNSSVGVNVVRRSSADGPSTSATGTSGDDLKAKLCGRKLELQFLLSKIHGFIADSSRISSSGHTDQDLKSDVPLQTTEGDEIDGKENLATEINPSGDKSSPIVEQVGYTIIVITGHAGIGKTMLMQAAAGELKGLPAEVVDVGGASNNMMVYGVWVKLLLELIPFDPVASPEKRGLIVMKYLHSELREKAYLLKDVLRVQFKFDSLHPTTHPLENPSGYALKEPSERSGPLLLALQESSKPGKGGQNGPKKFDKKLRRTTSEKIVLRSLGSMKKISFISTLAAKGALLVAGRSPDTETESEFDSHTSASLDSGFASETEPANDSDVVNVRFGQSSYSQTSDLVETELVTTEAPSQSPDLTGRRRPSDDFTSEMDTNDSEKLSLLSTPSTSPKSETVETDTGGFHRERRRRSSTEIHLSKTSSPEVKVHWLGQLLLDLLLAAAKKPLVIFLEDAHLMDNPSWSLLRMLSEEKGSGILVVAACRPLGKHAPKEFFNIIEAKSTLQLQLKELDELSTEALVRQKIISALNSDISIPPQVFRAISRRTQGHPLFAEQMAMALVELTLKSADNLKGSPDALRTLDLDTFNFSHSMEALITSRVDLLEPNHGLVLKVASVIGLSFSVDELQPILCQQLQREYPAPACLGKRHLDVILQGLEKLNFIVHHPMDPEGVYSFSNSVTRDAIYNMLPIKQRRTVHADVAEELLKQGTSGVRCVTIAEHYTEACKDVEEMEIDLTAIAIDHWEEAASNALFKLGQYKLAAQYYENAISLGSIVHDHIRPERIARWHYYLGKAYSAVGKIRDSFRNAGMALDYMGENPSDSTIQVSTGCSSTLTAELSSWTSQCRLGIVKLLTGRGVNEQDLLLTCEALALLSSLLILLKYDLPAARKVTKRYVTVAKSARKLQPLELARAYVLNAVVAKSASHAKYKYQKSLDILRLQPVREQPAIQTGDTHFYLGVLYQFQGKWVKAQKHVLEAERMYKTSQGRRQLDACRCLSASGHFFQGQIEIALGLTTRVHEYEHEHPHLLFWSGYMVIVCLDALKRYTEAAEVLGRLQDRACPLDHLSLLIKAVGWASSVHMGDSGGAAQEAVAYLPQLLAMDLVTPACSVAYSSSAEVLLYSLEKHDMLEEERILREKLVERVVKFFKAASTRIGICFSYYKFYEARLTLIRGNKRLATSLFDEAVKQALKLKMVPRATIAGDWLDHCSKSPGGGCVYSRVQTEDQN